MYKSYFTHESVGNSATEELYHLCMQLICQNRPFLHILCESYLKVPIAAVWCKSCFSNLAAHHSRIDLAKLQGHQSSLIWKLRIRKTLSWAKVLEKI